MRRPVRRLVSLLDLLVESDAKLRELERAVRASPSDRRALTNYVLALSRVGKLWTQHFGVLSRTDTQRVFTHTDHLMRDVAREASEHSVTIDFEADGSGSFYHYANEPDPEDFEAERIEKQLNYVDVADGDHDKMFDADGLEPATIAKLKDHANKVEDLHVVNDWDVNDKESNPYDYYSRGPRPYPQSLREFAGDSTDSGDDHRLSKTQAPPFEIDFGGRVLRKKRPIKSMKNKKTTESAPDGIDVGDDMKAADHYPSSRAVPGLRPNKKRRLLHRPKLRNTPVPGEEDSTMDGDARYTPRINMKDVTVGHDNDDIGVTTAESAEGLSATSYEISGGFKTWRGLVRDGAASFTPSDYGSEHEGDYAMLESDAEERDLERRLQADPGNQGARFRLHSIRSRSGDEKLALAVLYREVVSLLSSREPVEHFHNMERVSGTYKGNPTHISLDRRYSNTVSVEVYMHPSTTRKSEQFQHAKLEADDDANVFRWELSSVGGGVANEQGTARTPHWRSGKEMLDAVAKRVEQSRESEEP